MLKSVGSAVSTKFHCMGHADYSKMLSRLRLSSSFSSSSPSSSRSRNNLHNYYLRKRRKWPLSPYKAKWHETFNQQQAMRALKESASLSTTHLFSSLIDSFAIYNCDPTPNAYHFVIKTLMKTSQFHQLHPVLDRLEKVENFETPEYIFIYLIEFYGNSNRIQEAIEVFLKIPNFRCNPSVDSLNSLLSVLSNNPEGLKIVPQVVLKSELMNIRMEESKFSCFN